MADDWNFADLYRPVPGTLSLRGSPSRVCRSMVPVESCLTTLQDYDLDVVCICTHKSSTFLCVCACLPVSVVEQGFTSHNPRLCRTLQALEYFVTCWDSLHCFKDYGEIGARHIGVETAITSHCVRDAIRNQNQKAKRLELDNGRCIVTGTGNVSDCKSRCYSRAGQ